MNQKHTARNIILFILVFIIGGIIGYSIAKGGSNQTASLYNIPALNKTTATTPSTGLNISPATVASLKNPSLMALANTGGCTSTSPCILGSKDFSILSSLETNPSQLSAGDQSTLKTLVGSEANYSLATNGGNLASTITVDWICWYAQGGAIYVWDCPMHLFGIQANLPNAITK